MANAKANTTNVAKRRIAPAKKPFIKRLGTAVVETAKDKDVQLIVGGSFAFAAAIIGTALVIEKFTDRS
ncbi:hypothetical protein Xoosp14_50 [Xanthomonas phage Xoo-sp14]|nr:hypothetical protein Xoosp14_50 [Xanthomonas phage Xoo-sp14]